MEGSSQKNSQYRQVLDILRIDLQITGENLTEVLPPTALLENDHLILKKELELLSVPYDIVQITEKVDFYQKLHKVVNFKIVYEL